MQFSKRLLFPQQNFFESSCNTSKSKGSYNTMQFVLRLSDDVRAALDNQHLDYERIQATSTAIHENIHWWQHMGSNFGFIFSLAYPAFSHISEKNFRNIIDQGLTYKSIIKFDEQYFSQNGVTDLTDINVILNNYHDLEYAKMFALDNTSIQAILKDKRFFLHIGHCYQILWSSVIHTVAGTIDKDHKLLPNTDRWIGGFKYLELKNEPGFVVDAERHFISPLGIKAIFEGQAIFNQMQYLGAALNKGLTLKDFENAGMLFGIYREAFDLFLHITNLDAPTHVLDSKIALFLLVCDLAINPTNGFPIDVYDFENFIVKNDPGMRFSLLCKTISASPKEYLSIIKSYSKGEYISLSSKLSELIGCKCPYESIKNVLEWSKEEAVQKVLDEEKELRFQVENLPIRLLFSKYYRFQEDKFKYPNAFCWFGLHATGTNGDVSFITVDELYNKHHALFINDYDGEIKPVIFKNRSEENTKESFDTFYFFNILYDLLHKWVHEEGKFQFDYKWLANQRAESFIPIIKSNFKKHFNFEMDDIKVL